MNDFEDGSTIDSESFEKERASTLDAGARLGDYEIERLLGSGAMGEVYLARQVRLDQECAVKILPDALTKSVDFEKRFEKEGRSLAKLDHPGIVRVLNAGDDAGRHYLTMEYVGGGSLDDYLASKGGKLPEVEARKAIAEILSGLVYAHGKAIIHRDLKPANILRTVDGRMKISDFGLALVAGDAYMRSVVEESIRKSRLVGGTTSLTGPRATNLDDAETITDEALPEDEPAVRAVGETRSKSQARGTSKRSSSDEARALVGTLHYMSPEVQAGRGADARSDLYAVGVMAYQMLTGRKPMGYAKPPSRIVPALSKKWDEWVFKCMEPEPEDRFQSAEEALETLPKAGGAAGGRSLWPIALAAAALAVTAASGAWWFGIHAPEVRRQEEIARQVAQAKADAEAKLKAEAERIAAEKAAAEKAEAERQQALAEERAREEARAKAEAERLAAARGGLIVRTEPAGAEVRVGAIALDKSPLALKELKLGRYPVRVRMAGYDNWDGETEVKENDFAEVDVKLVRSTGVLAVVSEPAGLDAVVTCETAEGVASKPEAQTVKTPAKLTLPTGAYNVEYRRKGWGGAVERATVSKGGSTVAEHVYKSGGISVSSNMPNTTCEITSSPEGSDIAGKMLAAPSRLDDIPPGAYTVEFSHENWEVIKLDVTVNAGETAKADAVFSFGRIELDSSPGGAKVISDAGADLGVTPLAINRAQPGIHIFTLKLKGYRDADVSGTLEADATLKLQTAMEEIGKPEDGSNWTVPDYNIEMKWIAPGSFSMGDESYQNKHQVTLTKGYWLGTYEVTQSQWLAVMGGNPSGFKEAGGSAPVDSASWNDAMDFCRKLNEKEKAAGRLPSGYEYSLPTEAQWEYACRAGTDTKFSFGDDEGSLWQYGNYCDSSNTDDWLKGDRDEKHSDGYGKTAPVGIYMPNDWGLYDMHGNLWEWCRDWYSPSVQSDSVVDPAGPDTGTDRVRRGGSWNFQPDYCRSGLNVGLSPDFQSIDTGFRLALRPVQ